MGDKNLAFILILVISASASVAKAGTEIYKHVDKDGKITFSNKRTKGASRVQVAPSTSKFNTNTLENNKKFPKVSNNSQKTRDNKRRQILEHELDTEFKLLANAKQTLTRTLENSGVISTSITQTQQDSKKLNNKIKMIQKRVLLHEKNIVALKKELGGL